MTSKATFTDEEWMLLTRAPLVVGARMMAASQRGQIGRLREFARLYTTLRKGNVPEEFAKLELVTALRQEFRALTSSPLSASARAAFGATRGDVAAAEQLMLGECRRVAAVLAAKAPQSEADGVKRWLTWVAARVAGAGGHGWPGTGPAMGEQSRQALADIARALHPPVAPTFPVTRRAKRTRRR
jgi:hypothetical protein